MTKAFCRMTLLPTTTAEGTPITDLLVRGPLPRAFLGLGAAFFGFAVLDRVLAVAGVFGTLLQTLFLAGLLAFLIGPLVDGLQQLLRLPRFAAVASAYGVVVAAIALTVVAIVEVGVGEATDLVGRTDEITARIAAMAGDLQRSLGIDRTVVDLGAIVARAQQQTIPAIIGGLAAQTQFIAQSVLGVFGTLFIVVILSLYAAADPEPITGTIRRVVPNRHAETLSMVERSVTRAFRGFLRAQLALVLVQTVITVALCAVFGLPYPFLLTVTTGILMFIPFFGPPLALLPVVFVVLAFRPDVALPAIAGLVITQTVLVNALQPRLLRREVGLHPILVITALLAGSQIAGLWGAIFSIPVCAVVTLLVRFWIDSRAVNEVEGIELDEVVAAIQADHPEVEIEEAVAMAANQAEAMLETDNPGSTG
jgi:predicted PurR-regulated permease PerM